MLDLGCPGFKCVCWILHHVMICSCYCCNKDLFVLGGSVQAGTFRGGVGGKVALRLRLTRGKLRFGVYIRD